LAFSLSFSNLRLLAGSEARREHRLLCLFLNTAGHTTLFLFSFSLQQGPPLPFLL
jgi:hypothetical protein